MVTDLLDPKLDVIFKRQFVEHRDLLIDLINAVRCHDPVVVELEVLNPEISPEDLSGKYIVLDILACDADGQRFNIEMQTNLHAGWTARSVYYLARALGGQLQSGDGYGRIQPVIGIHLMNFDLFPEPAQACWRFELRDHLRPDVVLDRCLQLHMIELPKAERPEAASQIPQALAHWITYFRHWQEERVMQQIQHPPIQKAYQHLHALSGDELARREAFVRERALRDEITEKAAAKAERIAIGQARDQASILNHQLRTKFGELPPSVDERLHNAESAQLTHWADRVLFAETLEQVFSPH